jgi:hypothetical protein
LIISGENRGTTDVEVCYQYDKHFQITKYQVAAFREWYNTPEADRDLEFKGYSIPQIILDWPAHADAAAGYDFYLAPFWDNNDDGFYNPADGDYPYYDLDGALPCGTTRELRIPVFCYEPNDWGLYNMCGNVAEMVIERGTAVGGSFLDPGFDVQIYSTQNYKESSPKVGFRPILVKKK